MALMEITEDRKKLESALSNANQHWDWSGPGEQDELLDLIFSTLTNQEKPPMKTMCVNVYRKNSDGKLINGGGLYETKHEALQWIIPTVARTYLCTCSIEIPDLEGK